jgi:predicted ATPase
LLVAIDDVQWADVSTVTALRFTTRHLIDVPVSFVLTSRPTPRGHELASLVDASIRGGAMHVTLGPLADDAVAGLVEDVVGCPPGPRLRSLVASAAGSPFYVTEVVQALAAGGCPRLVVKPLRRGSRARCRGVPLVAGRGLLS